jgi:hypothetical protein
MIYWWVITVICVFFIGYMIGIDRGVRAEHARKISNQEKQRRVRIRPNKGLHLVKEEITRE